VSKLPLAIRLQDEITNFNGDRKMNATLTKPRRVERLTGFDGNSTTDAIRLVQSNWLDELPGAIFGLITVMYLVISLMNLIW